MTKKIKNQLLNHLYKLKSFGYEFHEPFDFSSLEVKNIKLPNSLVDLKKSVVHCYLCDLCKTRKNVLFGFGDNQSKVMFIYDEPTKTEDELGIHYAGNVGELLVKMIENVLNVKKEEVYITSLVKCKSQNGASNINFDTCNDYLLKQIELVQPKLIVLLGEKTADFLLKGNENFSQIRGKELSFNGISLIATYSASFLLRNPSFKKDAYFDMLKIKNFMENLK